jgi:hypothetical protein
MTDRELLELAAKAARIKCEFVGEAFIGKGLGDDGRDWPWSPLTDDGDALRLAVKLGIGVIHHQGWGQVFHPSLEDRMDFRYGDDAHAATRRAIVMAAAEIGERME